jgi:hypothetical protein
MGRIRKCCLFEVRDFKGHALQMCNIDCALPRVVLLLARSTRDQQCAALRHFKSCVKCGGSLAAMSTILRSWIQNPAQPISCKGVTAKSLQLTRASSTRETKKAERDTKKAERVANLEIWQREVQKPAVCKLRKALRAVLDALSYNTISEEHQVEDRSLGPRRVLKPSYFRALTNEAAIAKMLSLAVHGHMLVGQVAELQHPGIFNLCRQKPPPDAASRQIFPSATSTYSCLQMAAGRRDNSAGSQGYAFVVAKSVCPSSATRSLDPVLHRRQQIIWYTRLASHMPLYRSLSLIHSLSLARSLSLLYHPDRLKICTKPCRFLSGFWRVRPSRWRCN